MNNFLEIYNSSFWDRISTCDECLLLCWQKWVNSFRDEGKRITLTNLHIKRDENCNTSQPKILLGIYLITEIQDKQAVSVCLPPLKYIFKIFHQCFEKEPLVYYNWKNFMDIFETHFSSRETHWVKSSFTCLSLALGPVIFFSTIRLAQIFNQMSF